MAEMLEAWLKNEPSPFNRFDETNVSLQIALLNGYKQQAIWSEVSA